MGKSKKRSREKEEEFAELLRKVQKLTEKVDKMQENQKNEEVTNNDENMALNGQEQPSLPAIGEVIVSDSETKEEVSVESVQVIPPEELIDQEWLNILGDDPTESQALKIKINVDLLKRWNFFCKEGIKKEDFEVLDKKYECVSELEAPKLNPQIAVVMKDYAITRDKHMLDVQKMAGTALSIIGSIVTNMYESTDEYDLESLLTHLCDAGKILTAIIHKQSNTRKAFIQPGLSNETKAVLKESKIDEYLYGKDLSEKIKEAKALNKMGENLKVQQPKPSTSKQGLNFRTPLNRRPQAGQTGSTAFTGRLKQKVFLRNKQQFVNHRARPPFSQKLPAKQDKKD